MSCSKGCSEPLEKKSCPMWMADGRVTTDYRPRCAVYEEINSLLKSGNQPLSSYNTRMYLQQNAEAEMERQRNASLRDVADCVPCQKIVNPNITLPPQYVVRCNEVSCTKEMVDQNGLGTHPSY